LFSGSFALQSHGYWVLWCFIMW